VIPRQRNCCSSGKTRFRVGSRRSWPRPANEGNTGPGGSELRLCSNCKDGLTCSCTKTASPSITNPLALILETLAAMFHLRAPIEALCHVGGPASDSRSPCFSVFAATPCALAASQGPKPAELFYIFDCSCPSWPLNGNARVEDHSSLFSRFCPSTILCQP
jgi:hypothetical protein